MILALIGSKPLRLAVAVLAALLGYEGWKYHQRSIGATVVIEQSKEAGKIANEKAAKAHDAAARPGAAERLLKRACRDCKG